MPEIVIPETAPPPPAALLFPLELEDEVGVGVGVGVPRPLFSVGDCRLAVGVWVGGGVDVDVRSVRDGADPVGDGTDVSVGSSAVVGVVVMPPMSLPFVGERLGVPDSNPVGVTVPVSGEDVPIVVLLLAPFPVEEFSGVPPPAPEEFTGVPPPAPEEFTGVPPPALFPVEEFPGVPLPAPALSTPLVPSPYRESVSEGPLSASALTKVAENTSDATQNSVRTIRLVSQPIPRPTQSVDKFN